MATEADGVPRDAAECVGKMTRDIKEATKKQALHEVTGSECGLQNEDS